jgi:RNA polymerase sigma-70 factor, ECF subfamily
MKRNSLKEKYLVFRVKNHKDPEAYGELYDHYVERIYRFILFKVSSVEDAEDISAEVFLKSWQYIRNTDKKIGNLNALLYKMARNAVIDYYRNKRRNELPMSDQSQYENIMEQRNLEEEIDVKIGVNNIEKYLDQLKDEYREVVILRYIEQYSVNEIAEILNKSTSNIRVILHRAIKRLKELIGD